MISDNQALTSVQEMYFDICDLLNGCSYTSLGYDNRTDCLTSIGNKLLLVERYINQQIGEDDEG
jgi:hypothetical protein